MEAWGVGPKQDGGLKVRKNAEYTGCGILAPLQDAGFLGIDNPGLRSFPHLPWALLFRPFRPENMRAQKMDSELLRCTAAMLTALSKAATQCDTLHRTLARILNRHPYSDTLNRPPSIGHAAATTLLVGNTQLPTDSAEEPEMKRGIG